MAASTPKRPSRDQPRRPGLLAPTRTQRAGAVGLASATFVGLLVAGLAGDGEPGGGILLLYILPVALIALVFGRWPGLAAAVVGLVFVAGWDRAQDAELGATAYVAGVAAFTLAGPVLGYLVEETRASADRERLADEAFRRAEQRLTAEFDSTHALALVDNTNGNARIPRVNSTVAEVTGFTPDQLISMGCLDLIQPRGETSSDDLEQACAGTWTGPPLEVDVRRSDGTLLGCLVDSGSAGEDGDFSSYVLLRIDTLDAPLSDRRVALADPLTERELDVLRLVAEGGSGPAIAKHLYLSPETVKSHLRSIYRKLGVSDRAAAVAVAMRRGIIS